MTLLFAPVSTGLEAEHQAKIEYEPRAKAAVASALIAVQLDAQLAA